GRQRAGGAALVYRRAPAPDRACLVVEPSHPPNSTAVRRRRRKTMNVNKTSTAISLAGAALAVCLMGAAAKEPLELDFSHDTVGADPTSFVNVVGVWRIEAEGDNKVLAVDGRQWKEGQTAAGLADKARTLYGERYAEFLDRVQSFAYFP